MIVTEDRTNLSNEKVSLLEDRFILTQVKNLVLVFPATWVTEVLRIDRVHILNLPFYNPLLVGIVDRNGQTIPLINTAALLQESRSDIPELAIVVRLNQAAEGLKNVGLIIDRPIGNTTREQLPADLFTTHRSGEMVMMQTQLVPIDLWQPQSRSDR
jgi:chemotaxis signal transduction protein